MAIATLRKAAVFLASLPNQQAAALLAKLSPEQAATVSTEMAAIGPVDREEQEAVMCDFAASQGTVPIFVSAKMGLSPLPQESRQPQDHREAKASPFEFLHGVEANDLLTLIGDEHPQTIALVLSQLSAEQAAGAIAALSPDRQASVIARIARIDQPAPEVVAEVAVAVHRRLAGPASVPISHGMARVVKMFGAMRPATERKLLGRIAQADPELLRAIRRAMFGPDVAACEESILGAAAC